MRQNAKDWMLAIAMGVVIPALLFAAAANILQAKPKEPQLIVTEGTDQTTTHREGRKIVVLLPDGTCAHMELEDYITGVVLGEIPAGFDRETIKAQAVVARTYALKRGESGKHVYAAVCTDAACCQAYCSYDRFVENGGTEQMYDVIAAAVAETAGEVLLYDGELIEATYFSCSGGRTEDAKAVWGSDVPYLQAKDSPGEENAAHYTDTVRFTKSDFAAMLGIEPSNAPSILIGRITYTSGGGVDTIEIAGNIFKGTLVRQKLGLRSTAFTIMVVGDYIHIATKGFGHRVGMSQYGAEAMAVQGSTYREILDYYYTGAYIYNDTQN